MQRILAIDIGGTKLAAALVEPSGELMARAATATGGDNATELFDRLATLIDTVGGAGEFIACGVGCGGPMTPHGETVSPLNIPQWRGFPLRAELARRLGVPVFVDNDAKALALGEGWRGAAVGARDYLAMVVSTGVGGGIVSGGELLDGAAGNAGHIGHMIVVPDGEPCSCGARGCLEAEVSGTALSRRLGRPAEEAPPEWREHCGRLVGRAVGSVANLLDLRLALVGGSVALGFGEAFFDAAQREVDRVCRLAFSAGARVRPVGLGADGPLIGAAAVARRALGRPAPGSPVC